MNPRMHPFPLRRRSVNSDFERETKLVVLNFMGLVPASCPATAEVSDSVRVDVSSEDDEEETQPRSHSALPFTNCDLQPVPEQPSEENCSVGPTSFHNGELSGQNYDELLDNSGMAIAAEVVEDSQLGETTSREKSNLSSHVQSSSSTSHQSIQPSSNSVGSGLLQPPAAAASSRSPSPYGSSSPALLERQSSSRSTTSSRSRSSTRNASINVQLADVETLVRDHALPPLVIPLRDEISHEMEVLGQEPHDASAAQALAHSPETEVADMLRTVGDHVNEEFGEILSAAVAAVMPQRLADQDIPYATLRSVAESLIARVHPGWSRVAMVLLFSQRVAFNMLSQGHSRIGNLADNTTRFIEDHVADFIISNGGWQSILDMEVNELLADSGSEVQPNSSEQYDEGGVNRNQRHLQNDSGKLNTDCKQEFVPDCSNVPSFPPHDINADPAVTNDASVDTASTVGDPDIFIYMALCVAVVMMATALYKQVVKK